MTRFSYPGKAWIYGSEFVASVDLALDFDDAAPLTEGMDIEVLVTGSATGGTIAINQIGRLVKQ